MSTIAFLVALASFIIVLVAAATNKMDFALAGAIILLCVGEMLLSWPAVTWRRTVR